MEDNYTPIGGADGGGLCSQYPYLTIFSLFRTPRFRSLSSFQGFFHFFFTVVPSKLFCLLVSIDFSLFFMPTIHTLHGIPSALSCSHLPVLLFLLSSFPCYRPSSSPFRRRNRTYPFTAFRIAKLTLPYPTLPMSTSLTNGSVPCYPDRISKR